MSAYLATRPFQATVQHVDPRSVERFVYATPAAKRYRIMGRRDGKRLEYYLEDVSVQWPARTVSKCLICKDPKHSTMMHTPLSVSRERYLDGSDKHLLASVTGLLSRSMVLQELRRGLES